MTLEHCCKCGSPRIYFKSLQKTFKLCNHTQSFNTTSLVKNRLKTHKQLLDIIVNSLSTHKYYLDSETYSNFIKQYFHKAVNYGFMLSKHSIYFYSDLILNTVSLIPFNVDNLCISERLYLEYHHISKLPICKYCNKNSVNFINRIVGYADSCCNSTCSIQKSNLKRSGKNLLDCKMFIDKNIDKNKFTIVKYPSLLTKEPLIIQ